MNSSSVSSGPSPRAVSLLAGWRRKKCHLHPRLSVGSSHMLVVKQNVEIVANLGAWGRGVVVIRRLSFYSTGTERD